MICLTTFPNKQALLKALEAAGLAHEFEGELHHDATCVDVFPVWPRKLFEGQWMDDMNTEPRWVANLAITGCPQELKRYQEFPINPRRRFAGLEN